jgi:hypothetical protein
MGAAVILTREEIRKLTGWTRKTKQAQELAAMGIRFTVTAAGEPKVLQAEVDRVMLGGPARKQEEPNFDALNG